MNFYKGMAQTWLFTGLILAVIWGGFEVVRHVLNKPPTPLPFGCDKTYVNARGEDTGECE